MEITITKEIQNIYQLSDNTWSGGHDTVQTIIGHGSPYTDRLEQHLEEMFSDRTPSDTELNDYLWFESEEIYKAIGLNENGEIKSIKDELLENNNAYGISLKELEEMKNTGLFPDDIIEYLKSNIDTDVEDDVYFFDIEELDSNMSTEFTDEQAEWIDDNL